MKIERELISCIRAAEKAQPKNNWEEQNKANSKAVDAFLSARPALAKKLKAADARRQELKAEIDKIYAEYHALGLRLPKEGYSDPIHDEDRFVKAGGKLPGKYKTWNANEVITRLGAAKTAKEFNAILKEHGINWD